MPVANLAVAAALQEIADRVEIHSANAFRVRAYRAGTARRPRGEDRRRSLGGLRPLIRRSRSPSRNSVANAA
ncbi:MAG TPA: helix-hairpin-helix domain-containing protein [Casimicrobiaceae bacterium]|nr:helix-hairpin-helix domain-containing protein [Casimicrobiaceae bacterium]